MDVAMGTPRFDRNADQLCQILAHYRNMTPFGRDKFAEHQRQHAIRVLEMLVNLNDRVAIASERRSL